MFYNIVMTTSRSIKVLQTNIKTAKEKGIKLVLGIKQFLSDLKKTFKSNIQFNNFSERFNQNMLRIIQNSA